MRRSRSKATFYIVLAMTLWAPESGRADQPPTLTLQDFMSLALKHNPGVIASQAQRDAARAGERTAAAYPNPVIEAGAGPSLSRDGRDGVDSNWAFGVSQPIDYPALRSFRIRGAQAGTGFAQAGLQAFQITLLADVKASFYDVIRRQGERQIASEDLTLLEQVRTRVKVRVDTGEAPRYELIKADAELLNAQKTLQSADLRVRQAKAVLSSGRHFFGRRLRGVRRPECSPGAPGAGRSAGRSARPQPGHGPGPGGESAGPGKAESGEGIADSPNGHPGRG